MNLMNKKMKYIELKSRSSFAIYVPKKRKIRVLQDKNIKYRPSNTNTLPITIITTIIVL